MPLQIIRQDITRVRADAIVNTTNREMIGYSGVDHAIHLSAGAGLDAECAGLAPLEKGEVKITGAYDLTCKYILHVRGPVWAGGEHDERQLLEGCYASALTTACNLGCESLAFPLISAGVYGFPKDQVLKLAVRVITEFLLEHELSVYLCVYDPLSYEFSKKLFFDIKSYIDDLSPRDGLFPSAADNRGPDGDPAYRLEASDCASQSSSASVPRPSRRGHTRLYSCSHGAFSEPADSDDRECFSDIDDWLTTLDAGFKETLFMFIDQRGMTDVECYKRANVDRKTFWKIKNTAGYKPSKQTALAFAVSLRLTLPETRKLLNTLGMALSHSFKFDIIVEYFITRGIYDVCEINQALFEFDQPLLGSC